LFIIFQWQTNTYKASSCQKQKRFLDIKGDCKNKINPADRFAPA